MGDKLLKTCVEIEHDISCLRKSTKATIDRGEKPSVTFGEIYHLEKFLHSIQKLGDAVEKEARERKTFLSGLER